MSINIRLDKNYMWLWQIADDLGRPVATSSQTFLFKKEVEGNLEMFLTALKN